jgi:hypothetical protein
MICTDFHRTQSCLKKTGPLLSILMAIDTISIGIEKTMIAKNEQKTSNARLKKL